MKITESCQRYHYEGTYWNLFIIGKDGSKWVYPEIIECQQHHHLSGPKITNNLILSSRFFTKMFLTTNEFSDNCAIQSKLQTWRRKIMSRDAFWWLWGPAVKLIWKESSIFLKCKTSLCKIRVINTRKGGRRNTRNRWLDCRRREFKV